MLKINNWDEWQTFRKDRGTPPWIKLHRKLMTCPKWATLSDSEKGQLVSIWIVAADKNGEIPDDIIVLQKICMLDKKPNINKFIELGLMSTTCQPHDNHKKISCQPSDAPEKRREEESRGEKSKDITSTSPKVDPVPYQRIIDLYHKYLPDLPCVAKLTPKRKTQIRQRFKEDMKNLENWENFFDYVSQSDFLMGRVQSTGDRASFRADIEWLTNTTNFTKIAEAKYHV